MTLLWLVIGAFGGVLLGVMGMLPVAILLQRRAEHRARVAERRARESERLAELGSMTSGLAHEIKNPLSTIGLNAELLAEGLHEAEIPPDQRERLLRRVGALGREAERLRGILTDFLQFAGRMKLDPQPHDLRELLEELTDFFLPQCRQSGVMLRTQLPAERVVAKVDAGLLKQAILNLMINGVHAMTGAEQSATGDGRPRPELMLRLEADDAHARLHVIDTGHGIEPSRIEAIFHPYVSGRAGGTGLGLPTARRIVEEHGGRLTAHSEVGRGSDFVIELPRATESGAT